MRYGRTLRIFVMGQDPRALKSVELVNWTGQAFIGRREHLSQVRSRTELSEPGVYLLLSDGTDDTSVVDLYVGETDNFSERIYNHAQQKDWWDHFVVFVSKDKNLTKAHVKFLERELYILAQRSLGTLTVKNSQEPTGSSLPEADVSAMREYLDNMIFVLETLGLSYFPTTTVKPSVEELSAVATRKWSDASQSDGMEFYITIPKDLAPNLKEGPRGYMKVTKGMFVLKTGSLIRKKPRDSFSEHAYFELWQKIVKSDAVEQSEHEELLRLKQDIEFRSPSGAAAIVRGGQTNGRTDWKRVGDDLPLLQCETEIDDQAA